MTGVDTNGYFLRVVSGNVHPDIPRRNLGAHHLELAMVRPVLNIGVNGRDAVDARTAVYTVVVVELAIGIGLHGKASLKAANINHQPDGDIGLGRIASAAQRPTGNGHVLFRAVEDRKSTRLNSSHVAIS